MLLETIKAKAKAAGGFTVVTPPRNAPQVWKHFIVLRTDSDGTGWLVGPYMDLSGFASSLRLQESLREFMSKNKIRIGLRKRDIPPEGEREQTSYAKPHVPGKDANKDFTKDRKVTLTDPVDPEADPSTNRKGDRQDDVKRFWQSSTPQSHHIVEFNNLRNLGVSKLEGDGEMDYNQLPAVLLAAEFHQRYITSILKPLQLLNDLPKKDELRSKIVSTYKDLYTERGKILEPLWTVSEVILREADSILKTRNQPVLNW